MKHRHKWELEYTCVTPSACGLLWVCDCGNCIEWSKRIDYKKATETLLKLVKEILSNN